jgi:hypothetical protein
MSGIRLGTLAGAAAGMLAACSSASTPPPATSSSPRGFNVPTATATSSANHPAPTPSTALSGAWSGKYQGANTGTFTLTWTQSGIGLTGSIQLSSPANTFNIEGMLKGGTVTFSTVGSVVYVYTGTYSGNSMSGQYRTGASGTGSWSATKA